MNCEMHYGEITRTEYTVLIIVNYFKINLFLFRFSSGSDFEELNTTFRSPPPRKQKPRNKKILSSESDDSVQFVKEKAKTKGKLNYSGLHLY